MTIYWWFLFPDITLAWFEWLIMSFGHLSSL